MSGIALEFEVSDLKQATELVSRLSSLDEETLLSYIGALGVDQTERRIESEKTSPDGTPWMPNKEGTSILHRTGRNLHDRIAFNVQGSSVSWGSWWEHAHVHQNGATIVPKEAEYLSFRIKGQWVHAAKVVIPPRPFVGLSAENRADLETEVTDWLGELLQ